MSELESAAKALDEWLIAPEIRAAAYALARAALVAVATEKVKIARTPAPPEVRVQAELDRLEKGDQ